MLSAILSVLYAFQQEDWRCLLSFSSAENAAIAVALLGAALLFRQGGLPDLAGLAWTVALLHLAGHALAKGGLFLTADGAFAATGGYLIRHSLLIKRSAWLFGLGALFCAMSLAAMPPQAGFVSEWFVFQTVFQGFHLPGLAGRLVLALAGAGLALTAAVAFATFIKIFGIGLLGGGNHNAGRVSAGTVASVGILGACVLALAVGMPAWLQALNGATLAEFGVDSARRMHDGLLLVPLTAKFAFISPSLLVIVMPLLSLVPIGLLALSRGFTVKRVPIWYGGIRQNVAVTATTALTFSNALRTFYSFIYRPTAETERASHRPRVFREAPGVQRRCGAGVRPLPVRASRPPGPLRRRPRAHAAVRPPELLSRADRPVAGDHPRVGLALMNERRRQQLLTYFAIAVGGTFGCWARYAMTNLVQSIYGRDFPYATLSINVLGAFLMGFLFIETLERLTISPALRTGILTGVLGGYTTFSTFEMETLLLVEQGEAVRAALYVALSVGLGFIAAFGGAYIARNL